MFGHDPQPSIVYSYGARRPVEGLDLVLDQMRGAHRYRNRLVELERARRAAVDAALRELSPALVEAERAVESAEARLALARDAIKTASREKRGRAEPGDAGRAAVAALRDELKGARAARKSLRADLFASETWKTRQAALDAADLVARKAARAACGLYWSTYLHVEQSLAGCRRGAPPVFRAWNRRGHLAIQFQGGLDPAALATDRRLRLEPLPDGRHRVGSRRAGKRFLCRFRVGSATDGSPIFAAVPVVLHRPPPPDARIKWAHLLAEHLGEPAERWTVQMVLARERGWAKPDRATGGSVGVDVGWRLLSDRSLRVAVAIGDDGTRDAAVLPPRWLADAAKLTDLRAIRDQAHGLARDALAAWILSEDGGRPGPSDPGPKEVLEVVPAWLRDAAFRSWTDEWGRARRVDMRQWRAPRRLLDLWYRWRREGGGAGEAFEALDRWARHERHLLAWEQHLRQQLMDQRREVYRLFACRLRRRYRTAVVVERDLRRTAVLPQPEAGAPNFGVRAHQRDAAVSELLRMLGEEMETVAVSAAGVSRRCSACGAEGEASELLVVECAECGLVEDQDDRAARNLLASAPVTAEDREPLAASKP